MNMNMQPTRQHSRLQRLLAHATIPLGPGSAHDTVCTTATDMAS
jgi:hypothetical protein